MKLTKNGLYFFCKSDTMTFNDADIIEHGVTDKDLQELLNEGYIGYNEDADNFYWLNADHEKDK